MLEMIVGAQAVVGMVDGMACVAKSGGRMCGQKFVVVGDCVIGVGKWVKKISWVADNGSGLAGRAADRRFDRMTVKAAKTMLEPMFGVMPAKTRWFAVKKWEQVEGEEWW